MTRTTVSVDDVLLAEARTALGTAGVSDTVTAALAAAVERARLAEFDVHLFDLTDEDLADARSDRLSGHKVGSTPRDEA